MLPSASNGPATMMLAKFAASRARDAPFEAVAPITTTGWAMPAGDTLLRVAVGQPGGDGTPDLPPIFIRVREVAVSDVTATVTAALTDAGAYVQSAITPEIVAVEDRAEVSPIDAAMRGAIVVAGTQPIFDALVAMQRPIDGPAA